MKKIYTILLFCIATILSCKSETVDYENHLKLENYIKSKTTLDLTSKSDYLVIILQNEDCICTEPDMQLSQEIVESKKYKSFKKILIVNRADHKIFKKIGRNKDQKIVIIINGQNDLLKAGYIAMTDRIAVYKHGNITYYADLHIKKPNLVKADLLE